MRTSTNTNLQNGTLIGIFVLALFVTVIAGEEGKTVKTNSQNDKRQQANNQPTMDSKLKNLKKAKAFVENQLKMGIMLPRGCLPQGFWPILLPGGYVLFAPVATSRSMLSSRKITPMSDTTEKSSKKEFGCCDCCAQCHNCGCPEGPCPCSCGCSWVGPCCYQKEFHISYPHTCCDHKHCMKKECSCCGKKEGKQKDEPADYDYDYDYDDAPPPRRHRRLRRPRLRRPFRG